MLTMLQSILQNRKGQGMVEYSLIIALIAVVLVGGLTSMEGGIAATLGKITAKLQ